MTDKVTPPGGAFFIPYRGKAIECAYVEKAFIAILTAMHKAAVNRNPWLLDVLTNDAYEAIKQYERIDGFRANIDTQSDEPSARLIEGDYWQVYYMVCDYSFRLKILMAELMSDVRW